MKRILALILVLTMVFALAACGEKKEENKPAEEAAKAEETAAETGETPEEPMTGMANPWVECSLDNIASYIGWSFGIPEGATNAIFRWNESIGMAEMIYTVDGNEWCARMQKTKEFTDISGMYYEFDKSDNLGWPSEIPINDYDGDEYIGKMFLLEAEEGTVNLAMWYYEKEGLMFSLGCVSPDGILMFDARTSVFFPAGCNTDTSFEDEPASVE